MNYKVKSGKKNTVVSPPRMFLFSLGNTPKCRLFLSNSGFILIHHHFCQIKLVKIVTKVCSGLKGENTDPPQPQPNFNGDVSHYKNIPSKSSMYSGIYIAMAIFGKFYLPH